MADYTQKGGLLYLVYCLLTEEQIGFHVPDFSILFIKCTTLISNFYKMRDLLLNY